MQANWDIVCKKAVDLSFSPSVRTVWGATLRCWIKMGYGTAASGANSTTMGLGTITESYGQTSLGVDNVSITSINA